MWSSHLTHFGRKYQAIAIDLPGFGESPQTDPETTMEAMAREVITTLRALHVEEKAVFVGCSMGGYVLFQLARHFPDAVRAMGLVSTRAEADTDVVRLRRYQTIETVRKEGVGRLFQIMKPGLFGAHTLKDAAPVISQVETYVSQNSVEGLCSAIKGLASRPDSTPTLSAWRWPTLVLSGEEDTLTPPGDMKKLAGFIPSSEFQSIPRAGHLLNLENPDRFEFLLSDFLKRHA